MKEGNLGVYMCVFMHACERSTVYVGRFTLTRFAGGVVKVTIMGYAGMSYVPTDFCVSSELDEAS